MLKNYKAYTSDWYHFLIWLCYPVAAILGCLSLQNGMFGLVPRFSYNFTVPMSFLGNCLCMVEIVADAFCLGGVCSQDYGYHTLFQTSPKGKKIFKDIVVMDMIRRILLFLFVYVGNVMISVILGKEIEAIDFLYGVEAALWTYTLCTAAIIVTRFTMHLAINLMTAYAFMVIGLALQAIISWISEIDLLFIAVFAVVNIVLTVLLIKFPMKRLKESYYDYQ